MHFFVNDNANWLRLDFFFILGFTIVHLQWPMMYAFSNMMPENYFIIFPDDRIVNYATWLSALGGISFLMGFHLLKERKRKSKIVLPTMNNNGLLYLSLSSLILFLVFAGSNYFSGGVYKDAGGTAEGEGISKYMAILFNVSIIANSAIIIYQSKNNYNGNLLSWFLRLDKIYLGIVISYILISLSVGDRGGPLSIILTILILIGSFVRKFRFVEVFLVLIVGATLMTIIGLGRNQASGIDIVTAGSANLEQSTNYDFTMELANSFRTLNTTLSYVPDDYNYFFGSLWIADILAPIPFAQSAFVKATGVNSNKMNSSRFITYLVYGNKPSSGEGTSLIADIYINFGNYGVGLFMLFLGFFFKKLTLELANPSNFQWVLIASIIGGISFYYSRSSYFMNLRDIFWALLFFKILVKTVNYRYV
jgi:hypothetical protein